MDDDDKLVGEGASNDDAADEGSDDGSDVEDEPVVKGKGKAKAPARSQSSTKAATLHLNQALKTSAPKPKAAGTKKTSSGLNVILPCAPTSKTKIAKTQPGSIKEEPDTTSQSSHKPRAAKTVRASIKAPSGSSSRPTGRSSVMVKNKKHAVLQTHVYDKEGPVPVKTEELGTVTQASALPSYGCAQCSSSIQNQACLFLGWGKNATLARKELAKFVEVTPENVRACIDHAGAALNVFETSANTTAQAAQQFKTSLEELSQLCRCASDSEGQDALRGVVFQDSDFEDRLCGILHGLDRQVSFPSDMSREPSPLPSRQPSPSPTVPSVSKANSSAGSPAESLAEGDEVQGNLDELESSPARPVKGESASAD
ncbi:hypothetical protein EDD18DRAFT_1351228 [Armillaria luteobubalina]|uniref:Uncharacterized protein n=1 Tax=Armillaria luteobubalina TaxID=153913 RepID=A0AA39QB85_9AGAR|nr:hypothetical protein EDD18DRAFT_1351228 [Armillaria luteobubalina]